MKIVIREVDGQKFAYQVPDSFDINSPDISVGIPLERPSLSQVNWGKVREEVINILVEANVTSLNDLRNTAQHRLLSARFGSLLMEIVTNHFVEIN